MIYILGAIVAALVWLFIIIIAAKDFHPDLPKYRVQKLGKKDKRDITERIFDDENPPRFKRTPRP